RRERAAQNDQRGQGQGERNDLGAPQILLALYLKVEVHGGRAGDRGVAGADGAGDLTETWRAISDLIWICGHLGIGAERPAVVGEIRRGRLAIGGRDSGHALKRLELRRRISEGPAGLRRW